MTTWLRDNQRDFEALKLAVLQALALHYPDYTLNWFVYCYVSENGVGALLVQEQVDNDGQVVKKLICNVHQNFSSIAVK